MSSEFEIEQFSCFSNFELKYTFCRHLLIITIFVVVVVG